MTCPLCADEALLISYAVLGGPDGASADICTTCAAQIAGIPDANHWRGLASSMWDERAEIQALAARMLGGLSDEPWAQDLAAQLYLDDDTRAWVDNMPRESQHRDSNGASLSSGDTVILTEFVKKQS